jgi:hypothetical protein
MPPLVNRHEIPLLVSRESQRDEMPTLLSCESMPSREPSHDEMPTLPSWRACIKALRDEIVPELLLPAAIEQPQQEVVIQRLECDQELTSLDQESVGLCENCSNAQNAATRQYKGCIGGLLQDSSQQRPFGMIHADAVDFECTGIMEYLWHAAVWHESAENEEETKEDYEEASVSLSIYR